jgi:hypothetical protein
MTQNIHIGFAKRNEQVMVVWTIPRSLQAINCPAVGIGPTVDKPCERSVPRPGARNDEKDIFIAGCCGAHGRFERLLPL